MNSMTQEFLKAVQSGDPSAHSKLILSRAISIIENEDPNEILDLIFPFTGRAYRIGVTGPPGAGKSTLVNVVAKALAEESRKIGIIAVDPTSPFTGGAILGDRLRMHDIALHPNIFIRSMATRGSSGGMVRAACQVADAMDAFGMDIIIFETVGVGQSEIDIVRQADTTVVVLVPESGDGIQAMKAGLMEIADVFVVNKSDHVQADFMKKELETAIELRSHDATTWLPKVTKTTASENVGTGDVLELINEHRDYLTHSGMLIRRRKERIRFELMRLIEEKIHTKWIEPAFSNSLERQIETIFSKEESIYRMADKIYRSLLDPP
jgi:LAO/AO transport system kinase